MMCDKVVCVKDDVVKMVCDKVVCEGWCVKDGLWRSRKDGVWQSDVSKMVCDKVVCERWRVKDGL